MQPAASGMIGFKSNPVDSLHRIRSRTAAQPKECDGFGED
jgi:hypothetical protein